METMTTEQTKSFVLPEGSKRRAASDQVSDVDMTGEESSRIKNASSGGKTNQKSASLTLQQPEPKEDDISMATLYVAPEWKCLSDQRNLKMHVVLGPAVGYRLGNPVNQDILELIRTALMELENTETISKGIGRASENKIADCECDTFYRSMLLANETGHALIVHTENANRIPEIAVTVVRALMQPGNGQLLIPENVLINANVPGGHPTCACRKYAYPLLNSVKDKIWMGFIEPFKDKGVCQVTKVSVNTQILDHFNAMTKFLKAAEQRALDSETELVRCSDENARLQGVVESLLSLNDTLLGQVDGLKLALNMQMHIPREVVDRGPRFNVPVPEAVSNAKGRLAVGEKLTAEDTSTLALELFRLHALGQIEEAGNILQPQSRTPAPQARSELGDGKANTDKFADVTMQAPEESAIQDKERKEDDVREQAGGEQESAVHKRAGGAYFSAAELDSKHEMTGSQSASGLSIATKSISDLEGKVENVLHEPASKFGPGDEDGQDYQPFVFDDGWD